MPGTEFTRTVRVELDGFAGMSELEEAALEFARSAPAQLVAETVESMISDLVDAVVGPFGVPFEVGRQLMAPWGCTGCGSRRGFRRRGFRPKPRRMRSVAGVVSFRSQQLECLGCGRRFAPAAELLGLRPHQRRTDRLSQMAAGLATEVAYAKTSRLLEELSGQEVSARTIRRDVVAMAPQRVGPQITQVPILLLDGTGERAGESKHGVELHLAIGLVTRRRQGKKVRVEARLLGATLGEPWAVMGELLGDVTPGLIIVDGEEALDFMVAATFPHVPVQRCLWHLQKGMFVLARYRDRIPQEQAEGFRRRLGEVLTAAQRHRDVDDARAAYLRLADQIEAAGGRSAAHLLRVAVDHAFTFLAHPQAGRLLFGDKGRPELGTGVLERVMREMNRRTDVGVRWSIQGVRAVLMLKLEHKYHHGPWAPPGAPTTQPTVRFSLVA